MFFQGMRADILLVARIFPRPTAGLGKIRTQLVKYPRAFPEKHLIRYIYYMAKLVRVL